MDFEQALIHTQQRLSREGSDIGSLLENAKNWTPATLVGEREWGRILERARNLPISMGAFPFGFEFPLHTKSPEADFVASVKAGTLTSSIFYERARASSEDRLAGSIVNLFDEMDGEDPTLRNIVDRKTMLEFDVGSAKDADPELPGFFLRPGLKPIMGNKGQVDDVLTVARALYSCVGWQLSRAEEGRLAQVYKAQPNDTRMDSFGIFPSRGRGIRLAIMGINSSCELDTFLKAIGWPGETAMVDEVVQSFQERAQITRNGINLDVQGDCIGPTLGLTAMVKQRYTNDPRYFLDETDLWLPFLDALYQEDIVVREKVDALEGWLAKPGILYGKSGRFVLMRGIHHMKIVISDGLLSQAKAYVYMMLSALDSKVGI